MWEWGSGSRMSHRERSNAFAAPPTPFNDDWILYDRTCDQRCQTVALHLVDAVLGMRLAVNSALVYNCVLPLYWSLLLRLSRYSVRRARRYKPITIIINLWRALNRMFYQVSSILTAPGEWRADCGCSSIATGTYTCTVARAYRKRLE